MPVARYMYLPFCATYLVNSPLFSVTLYFHLISVRLHNASPSAALLPVPLVRGVRHVSGARLCPRHLERRLLLHRDLQQKVNYRVTVVVADLGWVELIWDVPSSCLGSRQLQ